MPWSLPPAAAKARAVLVHSTAPINIAHGPVSSGKTVGMNIRWFEYCAREAPPGDLLMVGKTERTLLRNVVKPMQDELGTSVVCINRGDGTAHILGRRVYLVGANDESSESKIRGMTLAGAYGDELTLYPESFWNMLLTRLRVPGSKFFGTTNPGPPRHYLKKAFIDRGAEVGVRSFGFKLTDNPFLEADYVARVKRQFTGVFYKRMILGQWVAAEGAIYSAFDEDVHVIGREAVPGDLTRFAVAGDYGAANPTCLLLLGWGGRDGRLYVLSAYWYDGGSARADSGGEMVGRIRTNEEHAAGLDALTAHYMRPASNDPRPRFRYPVYLDPSALAFAEVLRRRGYYVVPAVNDVLYGIGLLSNLLDQDRLRFVRSDAMDHVVDGMTSYVWDPKKQMTGEDAPVKSDDHGPDALRYGVATDPALVSLALAAPGAYAPARAVVAT